MILVVGCNDGIQPRDEDWLVGDSPQAKEQKTAFAGQIEKIIEEYKIQFVGEEWGLPEVTSAKALADTRQIRWKNINTCRDDLDRLGIPHNYVHGDFGEAQKNHWHRQREQVMLAKLRANWGEASNVLVICGFVHMDALGRLLRADSVAVKTVDYRTMQWYQAGVFSEDP